MIPKSWDDMKAIQILNLSPFDYPYFSDISILFLVVVFLLGILIKNKGNHGEKTGFRIFSKIQRHRKIECKNAI